MSNNKTTSEQIIHQIINSWKSRNLAYSEFFDKYEEEDYLLEVAPGRNRAIYLLGHLIASNDGILTLFNLGDRLFPELKDFAYEADKTFAINESLDSLKQKWQQLNDTLNTHFSKMTVEDWMSKHTSVSEEDFAKDPQRNKLNSLLGRTNHQSYHLGQLNLLTVKQPAL